MLAGMRSRLSNLTQYVVAALNGDSGEEDEEETNGPPYHPVYEAHDVVLPMAGATRVPRGYSSSASSSSEGSDLMGSTSDSSESLAARLMPPPLRGEHYAALDQSGYWAGEAGAERQRYALEVYERFRQYAPLAHCAHQHPYSEVDLVGLEYLVADEGRRRYDALPFSQICLNGDEPAIAFPLNKQCLDTFVVCRTHDYLYGRLIEDALLQAADQRRLPLGGLQAASRVHWACRMQRFPLCRQARCQATRDHDRKACRHQWVIYTRTDSAFYQFCDRHRLQNPYVDYDRHDGASPTQLHISYHLVNFLCGPLLEPPAERGVAQYDAWVVQSIEMIDLWNTATSVELNRNRTFGDDDDLRIRPADLL